MLFLLRTTPLLPDGRVDPTPRPGVSLPLPLAGTARFFDPVDGRVLGSAAVAGGVETPPFGACLAVAIG